MRGLERQARGGLRPVSLRKILSDGCAGGPLCFFEKDAPGRSGRRVVIADLLQPTHDRLAFDRQLEQGAEVAPKPVRGDQRLDVLRVEAQIERDASPLLYCSMLRSYPPCSPVAPSLSSTQRANGSSPEGQ